MEQATHKPGNIYSKAKRIVKFGWRHIFTLYILSVIVEGVLVGHIQGENACGFLIGAIFLDWAKQFIKPNPSYERRGYDGAQPLHKQWWNPGISGTSANHIRDMGCRIRYD